MLTDRGLGEALEVLAARAPIPVALDLCLPRRLPDAVEVAAYYVASEALANVVKHSGAGSRAGARRRRRTACAEIEVVDDGVGTADPAGSGLRGLRDRVETLDGRLHVGQRARPRDDGPGRAAVASGGRVTLRIVIADDSILLREGLARLLEEAGIEVVGAGVRCRGAHAQGAQLRARRRDRRHPHAADADRRGHPGRAEIREKHPGTGVLVLSQHVAHTYAVELLEDSAEGLGYLLKDRVTDVDEFAAAVRRVADGGSALDPLVVAELVGRTRPRRPARRLSVREREVLELMAEGRSNHAIGELLFIRRARSRST